MAASPLLTSLGMYSLYGNPPYAPSLPPSPMITAAPIGRRGASPRGTTPGVAASGTITAAPIGRRQPTPPPQPAAAVGTQTTNQQQQPIHRALAGGATPPYFGGGYGPPPWWTPQPPIATQDQSPHFAPYSITQAAVPAYGRTMWGPQSPVSHTQAVSALPTAAYAAAAGLPAGLPYPLAYPPASAGGLAR